jgi:hypothetical protein
MAAATTAVSNLSLNEVPFATNYGDILLVELQSKTIVDVNEWTLVKNLDDSFANQPVKIQGKGGCILKDQWGTRCISRLQRTPRRHCFYSGSFY